MTIFFLAGRLPGVKNVNDVHSRFRFPFFCVLIVSCDLGMDKSRGAQS